MEYLLFGGTSEGRELAEWLADQNCAVTLCVATEYGAELAPVSSRVQVRTGRMDTGAMEALMVSRPFRRVIDATHPYAVEVSRNLRAAAQTTGLALLRLVRKEGKVEPGWLHADTAVQAAALLRDRPGPVLLTTGSKELDAFAGPALRERCWARVLPATASLKRCLELGFPPAHILCMQGPFSKAFNLALLREYKIQTLVTKASGEAGGFWEKVAAAREVGCALLVVDRPEREAGLDLGQVKECLKGELL